MARLVSQRQPALELPMPFASVSEVGSAIVDCARCQRLRRYCRMVARAKVHRFRREEYWGRPVPGFGDPEARLLVVGLAPAAHGGNRTGRVFTGDPMLVTKLMRQIAKWQSFASSWTGFR